MTTSTSTIKNKEKAYPTHDLAKIFNNRAAHVITTTGNYEEGIKLFEKALKLTERSILLEINNKDQQVPCSCKFCSLESCLVLSEERKHQYQSSLCASPPPTRMDVIDDGGDFNKQESHATKKKNDSIDLSSIEDPIDSYDGLRDNAPSTTHTNCQEEKAGEDNGGGFVYRRLLRIDDQSINKNHYMGSTLSLVIIFNLALTYHLMGINNGNNKESLSSPSNPHLTDLTKNIKLLQHAVKLYELAYQLHVNCTKQQSLHTYNNNTMNDDDYDVDNNNRAIVVSLRLTMIVSNNLGQIHRVAGNLRKYKMCLQHLLSSIMYVGQQLVPNTVLNSAEFDGLLRNVSPIVFHGSICASAA